LGHDNFLVPETHALTFLPFLGDDVWVDGWAALPLHEKLASYSDDLARQ